MTSNVFRGRPITRPTDSSFTPEKVTACPVESRGSADKDERVNEIGDAEPGLEGPGMKDFSSAPVGNWRGMIAVEMRNGGLFWGFRAGDVGINSWAGNLIAL
jgi:hypothetical protein